jgi:hypothetical protein
VNVGPSWHSDSSLAVSGVVQTRRVHASYRPQLFVQNVMSPSNMMYLVRTCLFVFEFVFRFAYVSPYVEFLGDLKFYRSGIFRKLVSYSCYVFVFSQFLLTDSLGL